MVKTYLSMIIVAIILLTGAFLGDFYVNNQFEEFNGATTVLYQKVQEKTATKEDVYTLQKVWISKKRTLHAFISHTEIKELDMWISECATLVYDKEWEDAISKVEVIKELTEQIPKTFKLSWENLL